MREPIARSVSNVAVPKMPAAAMRPRASPHARRNAAATARGTCCDILATNKTGLLEAWVAGNLSNITLMCRDHEAIRFRWDHRQSHVAGRPQVLDATYAPYGARDRSGRVTRTRLDSWIAARSVPALRPHAEDRLRELGFGSAVELLVRGYGASLSDQYWLRPEGDHSAWDDVSCFTNEFPQELGRYLLPHNRGTEPSLATALARTPSLLERSPDSSLGGNLSKRWVINGAGRFLLKGGRATYFQQPFNELVATMLCHRLGVECVLYGMQFGSGLAQWWSICPCMVDDRTELVPAHQLLTSHRRPNHVSLFDFYVGLCEAHGVEARRAVEGMLVVDHIMANSDRHWNNFGVLVDSETREWLRCAPVFDTGESLWCDRTVEQGFGGYNLGVPEARRPFLMEQDDQVRRYCRDLSWLDADALEGFADEAVRVLERDPLLHVEPGRLQMVHDAVEARARRMQTLARRRG